MRALLCPASLKGVLSARDAAAALARGVRAAGGDAVELPIADGGEGTADALFAALGGSWHEAVVSDPLGQAHPARWLVLPDGRAVVEAAAAIGLPLLAREERDPLVASSRGLGELVARRAPRRARGAPRRARRQRDRGRRSGAARGCPGAAAADDGSLRRAHDARGRGASVRPSEGRDARRWCTVLERRLAAMEELAPYAGLPGAGAAGGLGAALAALGAKLVQGAPTVLDLVGFDERLRGMRPRRHRRRPGRPNHRRGQGTGRRGQRCAAAGVRCVVFGGRVVEPVDGAETVSLSGDRTSAEDDLEELGRRLAA